VQIARRYEAAGADCLSVLTDAKYFQGRLGDMQAARAATRLPVLRKDFVIDEYQIYEARAAGADCILLIAAALTASQLVDFLECARAVGVAALVETHNEAEMQAARDAGATLIGINSRDLRTFATDLAVVERLGRLAPADALLIAESGIKDRGDVDRVMRAGARAILVRETLMRAGDVETSVRALAGS
jgi:indole-3-glycerol phosphate synthase